MKKNQQQETEKKKRGRPKKNESVNNKSESENKPKKKYKHMVESKFRGIEETNPKARGSRKYAVDPLTISEKQLQIAKMSKQNEETENKIKRGRPSKPILKDEFESLCRLQCTLLEICDFFDVDENTVDSWCVRTYGKNFSEVFRLKRGKGQISLRRLQFQIAQNGNAAMAIFLGKNLLGQTDKIENSFSETDNKLEIVITKAGEK